MKKWVLFLLIAGFVISNLDKPDIPNESQSSKNSSSLQELQEETTSINVPPSNVMNEDSLFLLLSLDQGKVSKAIVAKVNSSQQTIRIASISKENMQHWLNEKSVNIQEISKDKEMLKNVESWIGVPIDNIIVMERQGYYSLISKIFPDGVPLQLTNEMKKDLNLDHSTDIYIVDAKKFLETIKALKETKKYDLEMNQIIIKTFSSQLSKPDVVLSLFGFITDLDQYFFTDLTMEELLSIGINVMKNPVQEVQKLELPEIHNQEVFQTKPNKINQF